MNDRRSAGARSWRQRVVPGRRLQGVIAGGLLAAANLALAGAPAEAGPPPPGPFTHFAISAPASATAGVPFNFTVTAEDASNATVTSYNQPIHVLSSDTHAVLPAGAALVNGVGTFSMEFQTVGGQTIEVADNLNSFPTSVTVAVSPGPGVSLALNLPPSTHQGDAFNGTAWALDQFGNVATSYAGTIGFTSTDFRAQLPANLTLSHGTGTFTTTFITTGLQSLFAADVATPSIAGSASIEVFALRITGYDLAGSDGGVFSIGLPYKGSMGGIHLDSPVVGIATTPSGNGYWLASADGGVFSFGDAAFYGTLAGLTLNAPIVGIASATDGNGYYLVAADGGVFAFGSAVYMGSHGALPITLNKPVVGIAVTPDGGGYWLVAADGGIFTYGDARYLGSMGDQVLNSPIVGMARTFDALGYWMVAADGGVFTFGDANFANSLPGLGVKVHNVVGIAATDDGSGYWVVEANGTVVPFGDATSHFGSVSGPNDVVGVSAGPSEVERFGSP